MLPLSLLSVNLWFCTEFFGISLTCTPHIIIIIITAWTGFSYLYSMLQSPVGSFSWHSLDPGQHYLPRALDVGLWVESEAMWEHEWRHHVTITSDHPICHEMNWLLAFFYQYEYESVFRLTSKHYEIYVLGLPSWMSLIQHVVFKFLKMWISLWF